MTGWECPTCHRCYAPSVTQCPSCPQQYYLAGDTSQLSRCPGCGQNRNMPGLTGCPLGSHYGSYMGGTL